MKASQIRVLLLLGCLSNISRTRTLVELLETLLRTRGAIPYIWDLYYEPLPMPNFTYDYTHQDSGSKKVQKLMQFADEADSFVWCTPIYHIPSMALSRTLLIILIRTISKINPLPLSPTAMNTL